MTDTPYQTPAFTNALCKMALAAGSKALEIYAGEISTGFKDDASPVTEADRAGEAIILAGLKQLSPDIPVLAEEQASSEGVPEAMGETFFLVDPLDGTREFINKTGEFTVNIALSSQGRPVCGVVYAPALNKLYFGAKDVGAWCASVDEHGVMSEPQPITARPVPEKALVAVASRSHRSPETDAYLKTLDVADFAAAGSSLKFCLIAEGRADIYPRFGRTMEWDTAAGQAVLEAAGGSVFVHPEGNRLDYGKAARGYDNPYFIAWGVKSGRANKTSE